MRRSFLGLLLALPLVSCGEPAGIEIEDAWARDTVGGTVNAAVFMKIRSPHGDRLLGASSPVANTTDLMTMESGGGAMRMRYLEAIDLPAGEWVSLDPAGLHVWLEDLDKPLEGGTSFPLTLEFEKAGEREIGVETIAPAAPAPTVRMEM